MDLHAAQSTGESLIACLFSKDAHSSIPKCKTHLTDLRMTRGLNQQLAMFSSAKCF